MTVRLATPADAEELTRLRLQMFDDMGNAYGDDLRAQTVRAFRDRLGGRDLVAFVVDAEPPGTGLVSAGVGFVSERLPDPRTPTARRGYVASMCTDPAHRRRGHARAVLFALLQWFADHEAYPVELKATDDGAPLYASVGFEPVTTAWILPSFTRSETSSPAPTSAADDTSDPSGRTANA